MSIHKFENDSLKRININEGLALKILKWLTKPAVKRALKKMGKDPEMKAAIADMNYHAKRLKQLTKEMEEEFGIFI